MLGELHQLTQLLEQVDTRRAPVVDGLLLARGINARAEADPHRGRLGVALVEHRGPSPLVKDGCRPQVRSRKTAEIR